MRRRMAARWLGVMLLCGVGGAEAATLRESADLRDRYIGAAVAMTPFRNEAAYRTTLSREFNMLVAENAFKMDALRPSRTTFNFTDADALLQFAEANSMAVRGHTLVWHSQLPGWLTGGNFTRDEVIAIMREHISTVMGRYRGRIVHWDVVNEAMADGTGQLRVDSFWHQRIGPEYIRMAFEFARDADPNAILYYNDYSAEGIGQKSDAVYNLLSNLRAQGVPVHGVGWQMHQINPFRIQAQHRTNLRRLAGLGLEISITEMDVRIQLPTEPQERQEQALAYSDVMQLCLEEPACTAVVAWGFTDKYSWIPGFFQGFGDALIFDINYQPKPAYTALQQVLEGGTAGFTLSASPSSLSVARGASGASTINITRTNFPGAVTFTVGSVPSGVTATLSTASTTGNSAGLTLAVSSAAALATSTITVNGSGGGLTRSATVSLTVTGNTGTGGVTVIPAVTANSAWFNEEVVRISNTAPLTALSVTIVIQRTTGVSFSGQYNTVGGQIQQGSSSTSAAVTYTFSLAAGQTLGIGSNRTFAAQTRGQGAVHPTTGDTYTVTYSTGGVTYTQTGRF
jgi:endo-1,4-beta-xylanase